jgi:hypothetical protein
MVEAFLATLATHDRVFLLILFGLVRPRSCYLSITVWEVWRLIAIALWSDQASGVGGRGNELRKRPHAISGTQVVIH